MRTKGRILFVTGTDTGIGKTYVSTRLVESLRKRGVNAQGLKVIETGCRRDERGELQGADALALQRASGGTHVGALCVFEKPLAPAAAASLEGREIDLDRLVEETLALSTQCDILIAEGAGGLLVPIRPNTTFADYATACGVRVLVVVGSRLGAINHALLTFEVLNVRKIPCVGYILNEFVRGDELPLEQREALKTNREMLRAAATPYGVREIGCLRFGEETLESIAAIVETTLSG